VNRKFLGEEGAWAFPQLDSPGRIEQHAPTDQFRLQRSDGKRLDVGQPRRPRITKCSASPGDVMENTTQLFLAVRFKLQQMPRSSVSSVGPRISYYHLSAYFAQIGRKGPSPEFADKKIGGTRGRAGFAAGLKSSTIRARAKSRHERTGQVTPPRIPPIKKNWRRRRHHVASNWPVGSRRARQPVFCQKLRKIASGATCWVPASLNRWTDIRAGNPRKPIPSCSID